MASRWPYSNSARHSCQVSSPSTESPPTINRITSANVYGWISNVNDAWSCTASIRYSAIAWNTTATTGIFNWGNLIQSTSVLCTWVVGSTDYFGLESAGAIDYAAKRGARLLEAYPIDRKERGRDDWMWHGAKSMFDKAGFTEVARRKPQRPVVRLQVGRTRVR